MGVVRGLPPSVQPESRPSASTTTVARRTSVMGVVRGLPPSPQPESRPRASADADSGQVGAGAAT